MAIDHLAEWADAVGAAASSSSSSSGISSSSGRRRRRRTRPSAFTARAAELMGGLERAGAALRARFLDYVDPDWPVPSKVSGLGFATPAIYPPFCACLFKERGGADASRPVALRW